MSDTLEFIHYIVEHIVDHPKDVDVKVKKGDRVEIYELRVNKNDFGQVLGKHGHHIDAIRTLVQAISAKERKRTTLEILE